MRRLAQQRNLRRALDQTQIVKSCADVDRLGVGQTPYQLQGVARLEVIAGQVQTDAPRSVKTALAQHLQQTCGLILVSPDGSDIAHPAGFLAQQQLGLVTEQRERRILFERNDQNLEVEGTRRLVTRQPVVVL